MFTNDRRLVSPANKGKYSSIYALYSNLPQSARSHMERVAVYGDSFYRYLREVNKKLIDIEFGENFSEYSKEVFCLHDIGRSFIPVSIINKVEKLTDEEMMIIKNHTTYAVEAIDSLHIVPFPEDVMRVLYEMALYHHERVDGTGYPRGLANMDIPFCARVCALVDTLDGIVSWKPYKAKQVDKYLAVKIMSKDRGTQFDSWLFDKFAEWIKESEE